MKCNKRLKYNNYVAFSHFHGTAVNNSGVIINMSRNDLARGTALSVRTVNRTVKDFIEEGLLMKKGRKLVLPFEKYKEIKNRLADKIEIA